MRASVWKDLFRAKGWLEGDTIIVPKGPRILLNFNGSHDSRELKWVVESKSDFLVIRPSKRRLNFICGKISPALMY